MAAPMVKDFEAWLAKSLEEISSDIDTEVFVGYIQGILEADSPNEEKKESIDEFLSEAIEADVSGLCDKIMKKWSDNNTNKLSEDTKNSVDDKLAAIMEKNKITVSTKKELTAEEKARKAAILRQYAEVSDGEEDDKPAHHHPSATDGATGTTLTAKNLNQEDVNRAEREKREKMKAEHEAKKEKDKLDREKQKEKQQDRKDKEKQRTQKGERRR